MPSYLVSRAADPLLGLLTGAFAYRLWEADPKNAHLRPEGRKLYDLVGRAVRGEAPPRELYTGPGAGTPQKTQAKLVHAQTEANAAHLLQGSTDSPLTSLGKRQAEALPSNPHFAEHAPTGLFVSPLGRTRATAAPLAAALSLVPQPRPGLQERGFGSREGTRRGVHQRGFEKGDGRGESEDAWRARVREEGRWLLRCAGLLDASPAAAAAGSGASAGATLPAIPATFTAAAEADEEGDRAALEAVRQAEEAEAAAEAEAAQRCAKRRRLDDSDQDGQQQQAGEAIASSSLGSGGALASRALTALPLSAPPALSSSSRVRTLAPIGSYAPSFSLAEPAAAASHENYVAAPASASLAKSKSEAEPPSTQTGSTPAQPPSSPPPPAPHLVVVTHGLFLSLFFKLFLPAQHVRFAQNTGVFVVVRAPGPRGGLQLLLEDDARHLGKSGGAPKGKKERERGQRSLADMWKK